MPNVGTLTVDLVANTAEFSGDLGKASQSATDFGKAAGAAGQQVDFSMREAKGSMMLLGEELGVHIPRHLQALIAEIPMVGAAFAEMLPIVGVIAAIAIIAKFIAKTDELKEKLAQGWDSFGATIHDVFNSLDEKLLDAGIKADELAGNHLAALHGELLKIDHQSLRNLVASFDAVAKASDGLMGEMKSSWYEIRMGSQGAQNALEDFKNKYHLLLSEGNSKGAGDLLKGTLASANSVLASLEKSQGTIYQSSQKSLESQQLLVRALTDQLTASQKIAALDTAEKSNKSEDFAQAEAERQNKIYDKQQKGLEERRRAEATYAKEQSELKKKSGEGEIEQERSTRAVVWQLHTEAAEAQKGLAKEELSQSLAMARLKGAAEDAEAKHLLAMRMSTGKEAAEQEIDASKKRTQVEIDALNKESALLNPYADKDRVALQENENKKTLIIQKAANEQTKIREDALQKQYQNTARVEQQMGDAIAKNLTKGILESQNMGTAFKKMGADMLESAAQTSTRMILLNKEGQLSDAGAAASAAYKAGMKAYPSPFNMVIAPIQAAAAFAGAMQFEEGGEIPGSGAVPIIGHGGETVVTKALTNQVKNRENDGRGGHRITYAPVIHAVDANGVESMLKKHGTVFARHITSTLRKMNKKG